MAGGARGGILGRLASGVAALRQAAGRWADIIVISAVAVTCTAAALALGYTTPVRSVENLMDDLRVALNAPPIQPDFVVIKIDDAATSAMREASPCHCLSPINKAWLGDLIAALDAKGVKAIGVDYLLDTWEPGPSGASLDSAEFKDFEARIANVKAPITVVVDPNMKPGVDYPISPKLRYSDARALTHNDFDDVIRKYDPIPSKNRALATEVGVSVGMKPPPPGKFLIRFRQPIRNADAENLGAVSPSFSAAFVPFVPEPLLKGKIAFIGSVTRGAGVNSDTPKDDMHTTPLRYLPGHGRGPPGSRCTSTRSRRCWPGTRSTSPASSGAPPWRGWPPWAARPSGATPTAGGWRLALCC